MICDIGTIRKSRNINVSLAFGGDFESEFTHEENDEWVQQFLKSLDRSKRYGYLIECVNEYYPDKIWVQVNPDLPANHLDTFYKLVYKASL